jgi:hypothetical protein
MSGPHLPLLAARAGRESGPSSAFASSVAFTLVALSVDGVSVSLVIDVNSNGGAR